MLRACEFMNEKNIDATETVHTHRIGSFPLDIQAAYHLTVQHVAELLRQADVPFQPVGNEGSFTFYTVEGDVALAKVVPWDSRMACLSDMEPVSQWGVSIWLRNELLSAGNMQALWNAYEGFYCPSPPNPVLVAAPHYEKPFQIIRLCLDDGGINFLSQPGASIDEIPEHLRHAAQDFSRAFQPFDANTWQTLAAVLRDMAHRAALNAQGNDPLEIL